MSQMRAEVCLQWRVRACDAMEVARPTPGLRNDEAPIEGVGIRVAWRSFSTSRAVSLVHGMAIPDPARLNPSSRLGWVGGWDEACGHVSVGPLPTSYLCRAVPCRARHDQQEERQAVVRNIWGLRCPGQLELCTAACWFRHVIGTRLFRGGKGCERPQVRQPQARGPRAPVLRKPDAKTVHHVRPPARQSACVS